MVKLNIKISGKADIQFETDDSLAAVLEQERPMIEKLFTLLAQTENDNAAKMHEVIDNGLKQIITASNDTCSNTKETACYLREMINLRDEFQRRFLQRMYEKDQRRQSHGQKKNSAPSTVRRPRRPEEEYE